MYTGLSSPRRSARAASCQTLPDRSWTIRGHSGKSEPPTYRRSTSPPCPMRRPAACTRPTSRYCEIASVAHGHMEERCCVPTNELSRASSRRAWDWTSRAHPEVQLAPCGVTAVHASRRTSRSLLATDRDSRAGVRLDHPIRRARQCADTSADTPRSGAVRNAVLARLRPAPIGNVRPIWPLARTNRLQRRPTL
jgi:hypothetical protein